MSGRETGPGQGTGPGPGVGAAAGAGDWTFRETSAEPRTEALPYSHLSVELGHLYMEDFAAGHEGLRRHFAAIAPWAEAALTGRDGRSRVSTCFLVDDYFTRFSSPAEVVPWILAAAEREGLRIDYLARESGCAAAHGVQIAALLRGRLLPEPEVGSNGARPPAEDSGWLANGRRSPAPAVTEAMTPARAWSPPQEFGAARHSVFLDVQLWDDHEGHLRWSCPFLAAVWQLLRLGLLRDRGAVVLPPTPWPQGADFPASWDDLPPLVQLRSQAAPFCGYRTFSTLSGRFLPVEHAVRVILEHTAVDQDSIRQSARRAAAEGLPLSDAVAERIGYAFLAGEPRRST